MKWKFALVGLKFSDTDELYRIMLFFDQVASISFLRDTKESLTIYE